MRRFPLQDKLCKMVFLEKYIGGKRNITARLMARRAEKDNLD